MSNIKKGELTEYYNNQTNKDPDIIEGKNAMLQKNEKKNVSKGYMSTFGFGKKKI